ncbi:hypothetical protein [Silvibacterium dinghuense]|uniref:Uncharacterized protein n=1 Tax=Silvibacterium dinghuense TaxID=1560006 RepID=A0A4Q1SFP3_9BACT|nr:hypothetical protein [Silvibacterium dinghuense]RXS96398.1 hypothetical protein ESZ00_00040 [Silvibacterium dinghuense]GGG90466.1 hypothetical protein GCM10011586_01120 [Silvibacterium dinghuense]
MVLLVTRSSEFAAAWQHSKMYLQETGIAVRSHLTLLLVLCIIPASLRVYLHLRTRPAQRWEINLSEALITAWRVLLCAVCIWAISTGHQWHTFKERLFMPDQLELAMQKLGLNLGGTLYVLLWELLIFALGMWLVHQLLSLAADLLTRNGYRGGRPVRRKAVASALRNLILAPLSVLYVVALIRHAFS